MGTLFYNIISLVLGIAIIFYGILSFTKNKKILLFILAIIHGLLLLSAGISGFLIPEDYSYIIIILMFVFTLSYILVLVFLDKKAKETTTK